VEDKRGLPRFVTMARRKSAEKQRKRERNLSCR